MKKPRASRAARNTAPPAGRTPTYDDVLAIARLVESGSRFTEFRLRSGDIEVEVKRGSGAVSDKLGSGPSPVSGARGDEPATPATAGAELPDLPAGTHVVRSPMVGTFYRAPEPGAPPFVEPGTRVKRETIVCIIEVMKLMNSITADVAGVVTHVLVENAAMVEPGQPLIAIRP